MGVPIPHQQRTITVEQVLRRQTALPPGWDEMSPDARVQFLRWRNDCIVHHQQQNPRRPQGRPVGGQRRTEERLNGDPMWSHVVTPPRTTNSSRRDYRPISPEFEPTAAEHNDSPYHLFPRNELPSHIRLVHHQPLRPPPMSPTVDPEWLHEVSQAFGPEGVAQLRQEQFRVMHTQNNSNNREYRPPQMVHAPPPPPQSQVPTAVPINPGQMTAFRRDSLTRTVQGRRRFTPNTR